MQRPNLLELARRVRPLVGRIESAQVRRFGRSGLGLAFRTQVLVLETTGRRTGRRRQTPLAYLEHDGGWLVSGGAGGQSTVDWVANLRAQPRASVFVGRQQVGVVAERVAGDAYDRVHELAMRTWPRIRAYERRAGRPVPIFVLRPTAP